MWRKRHAAISQAVFISGLLLLLVVQRSTPEPLSSLLTSLIFVAFVLVAGVLGGWKYGVAATLLSLLAAVLVFSPPYSVRIANDVAELFRLATYGGVGFMISVICELLQRAWKRIEDRQHRLEAEVLERRKAEAAEQVRADELLTTLSSIGDGVITTDVGGRILYLNASAESLTGWSNASASGQPLDAVFRAFDSRTRTALPNLALEAVRERRTISWDQDSVLISQNGAERPVEERASPIKAADGRLLGCVITFRDLSERQQAAAALLASELRFAGFMEHSPGLAWIKDQSGRYIFVNDAAEKAFRKTRAELYGKADAEIFDPETARRFQENDRAAMASDAGIQVVETLRDESGALRYSVVNKFPIPEPNGTKLVGGTAIDITERLQIEQELRRHQERLELAHHAGRTGAFDWNVQTDAIEWSAMEEEIFGLRPGSFGGTLAHWLDFVHPEDRDRVLAECRRVIAACGVLDMEYRIVRPDGRLRWIAARGKVETESDERAARLIGLNVDVTDRRNSENALREADRRKDEFLAVLAHELRNPLAPLRSGLEVLRLRGADGDELSCVRDVMDRQLTHMVRLIDDLLDISRIGRNKLTLRRARISLADVLNDAVEIVRPAVEEFGHELILSLPEQPVYISGDITRLAQVFGNLLSNSARYTRPGGRIFLSVVVTEDEAVTCVRDTGIGIPAESLPRIFEMFSQVDRSLERTQGGLGIGLALVKALVELHGGRVTARSGGTDQGAQLEVRLPRLVDSVSERPNDGSADGPVPTRRRILIADDNHDAARTLGMMLTLQGHEMQMAHDGLQALEVADAFRPEIVLLDLGMPRLNGYDTARRLREQPWGKNLLLVALTGWGQEDDRRKSQEAGFDSHLVKPVDLATLSQVLSNHAAAPHPKAALEASV